jgi:hypothetical protein
MLVSIASLAPIIIVAPVADLVGREPVIMAAGVIVFLWGVASATSGGSLRYQDVARAPQTPSGAPVDPVTAAMAPNDLGSVPALTSSPTPSPVAVPEVAPKRVRAARRTRDRAIGDGGEPT